MASPAWLAVSASAQVLQCSPETGYFWGNSARQIYTDSLKFNNTGSWQDSSDWTHEYYFDIPDGAYPDSLQLLIWTSSTLGDVDIDITATGCMRMAKYESKNNKKNSSYYKAAGAAQAVKTAHATESTIAYDIVFASADTTGNGTSVNRTWFDALKIDIDSGGATNYSDTKYAIKVLGTMREDD